MSNIPVEVGLQTETGYPYKGHLDYASPTADARIPARSRFAASLTIRTRRSCPAISCACGCPDRRSERLLVPDTAIGSDQGGRYLLVLNADNVVEQRKVERGPARRPLRVIVSGLKPDDRVVVDGILRAIPGQKVDPKLQTRRRRRPIRRRAMISKFFIERPVLANVIAILMVVVGLVALINLPVSQYPNVTPPTVQVTTRYPGASAASWSTPWRCRSSSRSTASRTCSTCSPPAPPTAPIR